MCLCKKYRCRLKGIKWNANFELDHRAWLPQLWRRDVTPIRPRGSGPSAASIEQPETSWDYPWHAASLHTSQCALCPAGAAPPWAALWACVTLSGNSGAGFSQCVSLPAPVPFQYSGNLRSNRERPWQTQHNSLRAGGGTETRENDRETLRKGRERERKGHAEGDKTGERHAGNQSGRKGVKRWRQLLSIKNQKRGREKRRRRRGFHSWQGKGEKAERARNEEEKGWPSMWTKEERATERRGGEEGGRREGRREERRTRGWIWATTGFFFRLPRTSFTTWLQAGRLNWVKM